MTTPFRRFVFLLFGLMVGSFLNVCIYRMPLGKSIGVPGLALHEVRKGDPLVSEHSDRELARAARDVRIVRRSDFDHLSADRSG